MLSWFEFLRIETDLAMTFIDSASLYTDPAHTARALGNARKALAEVRYGLENPTTCYLSVSEAAILDRRCTKIDAALALHSPLTRRVDS